MPLVQDPPAGTRRLLIINPNTNPAVTDIVRGQLAASLPPGIQADVMSPPDGPFSIQTARDRAMAEPAVLNLIRAMPDRDGYVLACFDDIAVAQARRLVAAPVISMVQAAIEAAVRGGQPFTIVTTVDTQVAAITALLGRYGGSALGVVRACGSAVADAAARTQQAEAQLHQTIRSAVEEDHAQTIVLGSGAYCGRAPDLTARHGLPFIDGLSEALADLAAPVVRA